MGNSRQSPHTSTALVTGGSGGIGLELAKLFARDGYNLVLVARDEQKLNQVAAAFGKRANISVRVLPKDLASPSAPQEIFDQLQSEGIQVDALVNNAGYSLFGSFAERGFQEQMDLLQVNVMALTALTRLFLPGMVERDYGKILNLGSTASFLPGPYMAVYYASKAYVLSFSEALNYELRDTGVTVTCLCPGPTRSGFQARAGMHESRLMQGVFGDPRDVARAGYKALMNGQPLVVPGALNWLTSVGPRFSPRRLLTTVSGWTVQSPKE